MPVDHFPLESLLISATAARLGIRNTPTTTHLRNINRFLKPGLENVRHLCGDYPYYINSGYRSAALNRVTPGSSKTSAHCLGYAADGTIPDFGTVWETCVFLADSSLRFDQLIFEYESWIHISFDPRMRMILTTKLHGQPYRNGLHRK